MDKLNERILLSILEARKAYEFMPNSYTYSAMIRAMDVEKEMEQIQPFVLQRLSY